MPTLEVVAMATFTAREFNQDVSAAKRAADKGPVVITDRGGPAYVLLSISDYNGMLDKRSIVDRLEMDDDFDFAPEPMQVEFRVPEL
jgi:prevent-host-death family protein